MGIDVQTHFVDCHILAVDGHSPVVVDHILAVVDCQIRIRDSVRNLVGQAGRSNCLDVGEVHRVRVVAACRVLVVAYDGQEGVAYGLGYRVGAHRSRGRCC